MKLQHSKCILIPPTTASPVSALHDQLTMMCFLASLLDQAKKETAARAGVNAGKSLQAGNLLVMLADDDCDDRELFAEVIAELSHGIEVKAVEDGLKLMNILNESKEALPAMIFLDLNMPGKSGKECLAEIRKNPRLNDVPVVIYSTSVSKRDIQETHGIGANLYVPKPNTFKGLIAVIGKVFSLDLEQLKVTPPLNQFVLSAEVV